MPRARPTRLPAPLPRGLLPEVLTRAKLLLCLDYDGTLSELVARPSEARPLAPARELLEKLAAHPERVELAIVSGRDIDTVRALLGIDRGLSFIGNHGVESLDRAGRRRFAPQLESFAAELDKVRNWMARAVPPRSGFVIEDKRAAIALHYRGADPAAVSALRDSLREFIGRECRGLEIMTGNMVDETIARGLADKGSAVLRLLASMGEPAPMVAYFGDDTTDEDAFFGLRDRGVTVLVGAPRPSWARYRVDGPAEVVAILGDLAAALEPAHRTA